MLVSEPKMPEVKLGVRASEALTTRLGRLYRGCGAAVAAVLNMCPKVTSLTLDVRLKGHMADRFWEAVCLAIPAGRSGVNTLTLIAPLPEDVTSCKDNIFLFGTGDEASEASNCAYWMVNVARHFEALLETGFTCHPVIMEAWKNLGMDYLMNKRWAVLLVTAHPLPLAKLRSLFDAVGRSCTCRVTCPLVESKS